MEHFIIILKESGMRGREREREREGGRGGAKGERFT
jgi:hypothetical protein